MAKKIGESANRDAKLPSREAVKTIVSQMNTMNAEMGEIRGDLGSFLKDQEERAGIHRPSLKLTARLAKMDSSKLGAWLAHFDHYRHALGLDDLAGPDMFADEAEQEEGEEEPAPADEPDPVEENVTRLKRGVKKLEPKEERPASSAVDAISGWH